MASNQVEIIWDKCHFRLKQYIQRKISDPALAEDLVQDIFVKIHSKINTVKDETKNEFFQFFRLNDYYPVP